MKIHISNRILFLPYLFLCTAFAEFKLFDPSDSLKIPQTVSASGMYTDILKKTVANNVYAYDINTPFWSDGAIKERFIVLPKGAKVPFSNNSDYYGFPSGTTFIKNFWIETLPGQASSRILYETRFLVTKPLQTVDRWFGFSYRWREDGTNADLVLASGLNTTLNVYPQGKGTAATLKKWRFPSRNECLQCHRQENPSPEEHGRSVLGFFTAQLNKKSLTGSGKNQIEDLFNKGVFQPLASMPNFNTLPKWAAPGDANASLELRARSYLASNCSSCHGDRGIQIAAVTGPERNFDFHDMKAHMQFEWALPVLDYGIDSAFLIAPGRPDKSIVLWRQLFRNHLINDFKIAAYQMPPLAVSFEADTVALKVIHDWILSLDAGPNPPEMGKKLLEDKNWNFHPGEEKQELIYQRPNTAIDPKALDRYRGSITPKVIQKKGDFKLLFKKKEKEQRELSGRVVNNGLIETRDQLENQPANAPGIATGTPQASE